MDLKQCYLRINWLFSLEFSSPNDAISSEISFNFNGITRLHYTNTVSGHIELPIGRHSYSYKSGQVNIANRHYKLLPIFWSSVTENKQILHLRGAYIDCCLRNFLRKYVWFFHVHVCACACGSELEQIFYIITTSQQTERFGFAILCEWCHSIAIQLDVFAIGVINFELWHKMRAT